jgi:hypothetical protein
MRVSPSVLAIILKMVSKTMYRDSLKKKEHIYGGKLAQKPRITGLKILGPVLFSLPPLSVYFHYIRKFFGAHRRKSLGTGGRPVSIAEPARTCTLRQTNCQLFTLPRLGYGSMQEAHQLSLKAASKAFVGAAVRKYFSPSKNVSGGWFKGEIVTVEKFTQKEYHFLIR